MNKKYKIIIAIVSVILVFVLLDIPIIEYVRYSFSKDTSTISINEITVFPDGDSSKIENYTLDDPDNLLYQEEQDLYLLEMTEEMKKSNMLDVGVSVTTSNTFKSPTLYINGIKATGENWWQEKIYSKFNSVYVLMTKRLGWTTFDFKNNNIYNIKVECNGNFDSINIKFVDKIEVE